ncbi:MAG: hypothetical protein ACRBHB_02475 [Arenicella sp.]
MKLVKKTAEYSILQRNDERYAVQASNGKMINGEEKAKILLDEKLITVSKANPKPAEEAPAEDAAEAEAPAEEAAEG